MNKIKIIHSFNWIAFADWIADGNAVQLNDGLWVEQETQYRVKFTFEELQKFFHKGYTLYFHPDQD